MEKMVNSKPTATNSGTVQNRKRTWSASNDGGNGGSPSSTSSARGGGSGGGSGGYSGNSGNYSGGGKKSHRSQQWQEMRRWNDPSQRDSRASGHDGDGGNRRDGYGQPQYPREYGGGGYRGNYRGNQRGSGGYDRRFY
jgi:hypothetical protein